MGGLQTAKRGHQFFDFPLVEHAFLIDLDSGFLRRLGLGMQLAGQLRQVLARVIEIDDLQRTRKMPARQRPATGW